MKLTVRINDQLTAKLRKYIWLRYGEHESHWGKIKEVTEQALGEFFDRELPKLEKN